VLASVVRAPATVAATFASSVVSEAPLQKLTASAARPQQNLPAPRLLDRVRADIRARLLQPSHRHRVATHLLEVGNDIRNLRRIEGPHPIRYTAIIISRPLLPARTGPSAHESRAPPLGAIA